MAASSISVQDLATGTQRLPPHCLDRELQESTEATEETAEKIAETLSSLKLDRAEWTGPIPGYVRPQPA